MMQYFKTEKITDRMTRITDLTGVSCYLITGETQAALIDTGTGFGDISECVRKLTELPITVILTHGHCDHAGGAANFSQVYLNERDWDLVKVHAAMPSRIWYVNLTTGGRYHVTEQELVPGRTEAYLPLRDGQLFDLGGLTLETIAVAGHTQGTVCILLREDRRIILGDACNTATFLWDDEATGIDTYLESLLRLKEREGEYDSAYLCHGPAEVGEQVVDEVIELCNAILAGTDDAAPFPVIPVPEVVSARAQGPDGMRLDGKLGNIIYHKGKIRR